MDEAAKGAAALATKDFAGAIRHYTAALAAHPQAVDYYIKRSTAYTRTAPSNPLLALFDAETAVSLARARGKRELIAQAQLRRGVALFGAERWADAGQCFAWARALAPKDNSLGIWDVKVREKLEALEAGDPRAEVKVVETPDVSIDNLDKAAQEAKQKAAASAAPAPAAKAPKPPAQTPASQIRHDWYQTPETVTVTLMAKGVPKDKAKVEIETDSLAISFPLASGSDYDFSLDPLFASIDSAASSYRILSTKVEFTLKKAKPGQKWGTLEAPERAAALAEQSQNANGSEKETTAKTNASAGPAYPSSSKSGPKNWDKLADELTTRPKKDKSKGDDGKDAAEEEAFGSDDEGDPVNSFFKKLYQGADPDTRRAMVKSYQESNGTALSTNWGEVGKGPVETSPPDGMEAKKWEQ